MKRIRIGNGAGFWGDSPGAPGRLLKSGDLDYLTLEYLAELTLSILAHQKRKNPAAGFVTDVPAVVKDLASVRQLGSEAKLITNGGGMNPRACALAVARVLEDHELQELKVGISTGDDFHDRIEELLNAGETLENLDTGEGFEKISNRVASANVYLGAAGIRDVLAEDATVALTGRIADAALVTGPCLNEFGWSFEELEKLARATVAGHLIECGAQVTGGFYSDWDPSIPLGNIGYPIAEIDALGETVITKPPGTGGIVNTQTCAEQLIYEIGDPARYMTPDVIADFSAVGFEQLGPDRVQAKGARSAGVPDKLKASIAYYDGFMSSGMITIVGPHAEQKARIAGEAIFQKLLDDGIEFEAKNIEVIGAGDSLPGLDLANYFKSSEPWEVVLRVSARSMNRAHTDRLGRELAPLVTSGPPGVTGYTGARSRSTPVLSFWPATVSREHFAPETDVRSAREWLSD